MARQQLIDCLAKLRDAQGYLEDGKVQVSLEAAHTALEDYLRDKCTTAGANASTTIPNTKGVGVAFPDWKFWNYISWLEQQNKISKPLKDAFMRINTLRVPSKHKGKLPQPALVKRSILVIEYAIRSMLIAGKKPRRPHRDRSEFKINGYGYGKGERTKIRLRLLLKLLGFEKNIPDPRNFQYKGLGPQIDACGGVSGTFFVFRCVSEQDLSKKGLRGEIRDILSKEKEISKKIDLLYPNAYPSKVFVICLDDIEPSPGDKALAKSNDIKLVDTGQVKNWFYYYPMLGITLKYHILKTLSHDSAVIVDGGDDPFIRYRAFRIQEGGKMVYHFLADPERLSELGYVYRLEVTDQEGYQRDLQIPKLRDINLYLMQANHYFPNNLVFCFDTILNDDAWPDFYPDLNQGNATTQFGTLCLPKAYCSGEVIDGQHRLYGYLDTTEDQHCLKVLRKRIKTDRLSVVAVSDPSSEERARLFVDINSNQTKVNIRRTWALNARVHRHTEIGFVARVIIGLNESPAFKDKIEIPGISRSKGRKLNIANLGKGLVDQDILDREVPWNVYCGNRHKVDYADDVTDSVKEISRFFKPFKKGTASRFVFTNNGANVMLRIFAELLKYETKPGKKLGRPKTNSATKSSLEYVLSMSKYGGTSGALRQTSSEAGRGDMALAIAKRIRTRKNLENFASDLFN